MTENAAKKLYKETGIGPEKIQVCELHDCFSANELITYEALGLCKPGQAGQWIDSDSNTYGGQVVVNPSGGLISKGHPLGATGMAQCAELVWQLRGMAGARQVKDVTFALQHNLGLGGAAVVGIYKKKTAKGSGRDDVSADPEYLEELERNGMLRSQKRTGKTLGTLMGPMPKL
jgi:acetyl-CoA acetyltransferase